MRRLRFFIWIFGERGWSGGRRKKPLLVHFSAGKDLLFL